MLGHTLRIVLLFGHFHLADELAVCRRDALNDLLLVLRDAQHSVLPILLVMPDHAVRAEQQALEECIEMVDKLNL